KGLPDVLHFVVHRSIAMEKTVTAREANQNFSRLLAEAEKGMEIVITKRGKAVARIAPVLAGRKKPTAKQRAAIQRMMQRSRHRHVVAPWTFDRDSLHER